MVRIEMLFFMLDSLLCIIENSKRAKGNENQQRRKNVSNNKRYTTIAKKLNRTIFNCDENQRITLNVQK